MDSRQSYCTCAVGVALQRADDMNRQPRDTLENLWNIMGDSEPDHEEPEPGRVDQLLVEATIFGSCTCANLATLSRDFNICPRCRHVADTITHVRSICGCHVCTALRGVQSRIEITPALSVPVSVTGTVTLDRRVREVMTPNAAHLFHYQQKEGDPVAPDFTDGIFVTKEPDEQRARLVVHDQSIECSVGAWVNPHDLRRIAAGLLRAADVLDGTIEEPDRTQRSVWERLRKPEVG